MHYIHCLPHSIKIQQNLLFVFFNVFLEDFIRNETIKSRHSMSVFIKQNFIKLNYDFVRLKEILFFILHNLIIEKL